MSVLLTTQGIDIRQPTHEIIEVARPIMHFALTTILEILARITITEVIYCYSLGLNLSL